MFDNNLNSEVLENNDLLKNETLNNEVVESIDEYTINNNEEHLIEDLNDDKDFFTPVVSDGIFEEEILDLNDEKIETIDTANELDNSILNIEDNHNEDIVDLNEEVNNNSLNSVIDNDNHIEEKELDDLEKDNLDNVSDTENENNNVLEESSEIQIQDSKIENNELVDNNLLENNNEIEQNEVKEETLLSKYGENLSIKEYVCNPAIGRDNEIKQLILTLLTPEKSGILVGKPGIGSIHPRDEAR